MVKRPSLVVVVKHPLAEVVCDVEGPVVVAAELVVDDDDGVVDAVQAVGVLAQEDVTALEVVVAEHQRGVDPVDRFPGMVEKCR